MKSLHLWITASFIFFSIICCILDYRIDALEQDKIELKITIDDLINRLETQYRFTEKVMKMVNKMERGVDK